MKAKIRKVKRDTHRQSGEEFLDVEVAFGDEVKKFGFPVTATEKEIKAEIKMHGLLLEKEAEAAVKEKQKEEKNKKVDETIESLTGSEI